MRQLHGEVGNVQVASGQAEWLLGKHRESHVFQHRQDRRKRPRTAAPEQFQVLMSSVLPLRGAQLDFDSTTLLCRFQAFEVGYR